MQTSVAAPLPPLPSLPLPDGSTATRATHHAREATRWLHFTDTTTDPEAAADAALLAQAHALTSMAWTQLNPPGRRPRECKHHHEKN